MIIRILTFSDRGERVAERICKKLLATEDIDYMRCDESTSLSEWTGEWFYRADGLIFVGACGIGVRAIAPFVDSKVTDPAVVVVDELGKYAIPILSGHLGGANELAERVAAILKGVPVITTATDINGVFSVDDWARKNDCTIINPEKIKSISGRLLDGVPVSIKSNFPIMGKEPKGVEMISGDEALIHISTRRDGIFGSRHETKDPGEDADYPMIIVPHIAVLGVGCRRGTDIASIKKCFSHVMDELGIFEEAIYRICTIDMKKHEPALVEFARSMGVPLVTFSSNELKTAVGDFSSSDFVEEITGVDNVCERSAVLGASHGRLVLKKTVWEGVTMAVAFKNLSLSW